MRKLIAGLNMSLDGYCDHTAMIADEEIHEHYNELLSEADTVIYGRITYQLMESFWPTVAKNPTGNQPVDEFAVLIDNMSKIVYSHTLEKVEWKNSILKREVIKEDLLNLKQQSGKNILVGSPSLIRTVLQLDVVDEYQLCVQPMILGHGLQLHKDLVEKIDLELLRTKTFRSGSILLCYKPKHRTPQE